MAHAAMCGKQEIYSLYYSRMHDYCIEFGGKGRVQIEHGISDLKPINLFRTRYFRNKGFTAQKILLRQVKKVYRV